MSAAVAVLCWSLGAGLVLLFVYAASRVNVDED